MLEHGPDMSWYVLESTETALYDLYIRLEILSTASLPL